MSPLLLVLAACKSPTPTPTAPPETDTEADTDTDADTDADADADTDTDTDTDTDVEMVTDSFTDGTWTTTVTVPVAEEATLTRTYTFSTDHPPRAAYPTQVTVTELPDQPVLRSGSLLFDGLFALAVQEARENAVGQITDGAFANGAAQPCDCYQTGELWSWVWTRDTAYAADLGLAWLDPERARNSRQFKLSELKEGGGLQIVQDTGTGGSWPVSTDRVVWALGAQAVLDAMEPGADRTAFLEQAQQAVVNTAEMDRTYVYDPDDGLYRGEQSFLDWREQTYNSSTADDVTPIAESKALGTNLAHWILLDAAARWSEQVDPTAAPQYRAWADDLALAIEAGFLTSDGWHSLKGPSLDPSLQAQRDLLAESLAALHLPDDTRDLAALSSYPNGPHGPPVIWPQQRDVPIYHNRGQWPFVTAYGMRAAARVRNADFYDRGAEALVAGAALNLTNLENAEWLTGEPWFDDGGLSGPVVNSRRQLWSVAAYLSFVVHDVFGVRTGESLTFEPFVTEAIRDAWLSDTVTLHRFPWRGETVDLTLTIPSGAGPFTATGTHTTGSPTVSMTLAATSAAGSLTEADGNDVASWLAPAEPVLSDPNADANGVVLTWTGGTADVLRDGEVVAEGVSSPWTDPATVGDIDRSWCYALRANAGIRSVNAAPRCWWGEASSRVQSVDAHHFYAADGTWSTANGRPHYEGSSVFSVSFRPHHTGPHALQLSYANGAGARNTGITAAHKHYTLLQADTVVSEGTFVLPHTGAWDQWRESTLVQAELDATATYTLTLADAPNMADLAAMEVYTAGPGGGPDGYNFADVTALKLLALEGPASIPPANALAFDGIDDLAAFATAQQLTPGAVIQPWERFALHWDEHFVYLAIVGQAFEDPFKPFVLYLESDPGTAVPGTGFDYSSQTPELPFTPTHAIALRRQHDANDGIGPWSGLWVPDGSSWQQRQRFVDGVDVWVAADQHTLAARIPRYQLGDPNSLRFAGHVVNGVLAEEWKDTVPATHTPWAAGGGEALTVDLSTDPLTWAE